MNPIQFTTQGDRLSPATLARMHRRTIGTPMRRALQHTAAPTSNAPAPATTPPTHTAPPPRAHALLKLLATTQLTHMQAITIMDGDRAATAAAFDWLRTSGLIEPCGNNIAGRSFRARPGATLRGATA